MQNLVTVQQEKTESHINVQIGCTIVQIMGTLINPGYEKILTLFHSNKHAKIHVREIARRTGLYAHSVNRFLNQLEKKSILKSEKDGNLKKYSLRLTKETFLLLAYLDLQQFEKLPGIRKHAILYFLKELKEKPIIAFLFGSTAKNIFRSDSDIDILLIVNKPIDTEKAKNYADAQTGIKVNSIQITYHEFIQELKLKQEYVIQAAIETGYPLTNHIEYYEAILNESA